MANVDFAYLARRTPGFTGADLANVINEGALLAIRQGGGRIGMEHLSEAILRVLHGPQRRGKLISADERSRLAYHEAGHAIVAAGLGQGDTVQRVSIVARAGRAIGSSVIAGEDERILLTYAEMQARLAVTMAGAAAEEVVFAELSTSSVDDLARANTMAREMVGVHGMSPEVGPLRLLSVDGAYMDGETRLTEAVSGQTLGAFDAAVRSLIEAAQERARRILASNRDRLDAMASALEEQETLEGAALEAAVADIKSDTGRTDNGKPSPRRRAASVTRERPRSG